MRTRMTTRLCSVCMGVLLLCVTLNTGHARTHSDKDDTLAITQSFVSSSYYAQDEWTLYSRYILRYLPYGTLLALSKLRYKKGVWEQRWGGGIENTFITVGHVQEEGAYTIFKDISRMSAWNASVYDTTRWRIIRKMTDKPTLGMMLSLPQFFHKKHVSHSMLSWYMAGISSSQDIIGNEVISQSAYDEYVMGGTLGYAHNIWEGYVLYRYAQRKSLPFSTSKWDGWIVTEPSALFMHQMAMRQYMRSDHVHLTLSLKQVISDTLPDQGAGGIVMRVLLDWLEFGTHFSFSDTHAIDSNWKFSHYIWSSSGELVLFYMKTPFINIPHDASIRARVEVSEYNQEKYRISSHHAIRRSYVLSWTHTFPLALFRHMHIPASRYIGDWKFMGEYGYNYSIYGEYHMHRTALSVMKHPWNPEVGNKVYWYIDEHSRKGKKMLMNNTVALSYHMMQAIERLWGEIQWDIARTLGDSSDWSIVNMSKELSVKVGMAFRHGLKRGTALVGYELSHTRGIDGSVFRHKPYVSISFRIEW